MDYVVISFLNINSGVSYSFEKMKYNTDSALWEYVFDVLETTPNGQWRINYIQAYDKIGNVAHLSLADSVFEIYDAADSEKPVIYLDTIQFTKVKATVGDQVKISIRITDNVEIERAVISVKNLNSGASTSYEQMQYNATTDRWEYIFNVTDQTPTGEWEVDYLVAYDKVGNYSSISSYYPAFEVYGAADSERPVIYRDTLSISQKTATVGDKVKISLKITENVRMDYVVISFHNTDTGKMIGYDKMINQSGTDIWEYIFEVTSDIPNGQWIIDDLQAYDIYGNYDIFMENVSAFFTYSTDSEGNPNYYTIRYNSNGSGEPDVEEMGLLNSERSLAVNMFSRKGYTFKNWNTSPDGNGITYSERQLVQNLSITEGGTITLYAQWKPEQYLINWKNWNGTVLQNGFADYGSIPKYSGDTPVRDKDEIYTYEFIGWDPEITPVTNMADYTAIYRPIEKATAQDNASSDPGAETKDSGGNTDGTSEDESTDNTGSQNREEYYVFSGIKQQYRLGSRELLVFIIKRIHNDESTYRLLRRVMVDGMDVKKENYSTRPGSLIIELKPKYIESFLPGDHLLHVEFEDGEIDIPFSVYKEKGNCSVAQ